MNEINNHNFCQQSIYDTFTFTISLNVLNLVYFFVSCFTTFLFNTFFFTFMPLAMSINKRNNCN